MLLPVVRFGVGSLWLGSLPFAWGGRAEQVNSHPLSEFQSLRTRAISTRRGNEGRNLWWDLGAYVALTGSDKGSITNLIFVGGAPWLTSSKTLMNSAGQVRRPVT